MAKQVFANLHGGTRRRLREGALSKRVVVALDTLQQNPSCVSSTHVCSVTDASRNCKENTESTGARRAGVERLFVVSVKRTLFVMLECSATHVVVKRSSC